MTTLIAGETGFAKRARGNTAKAFSPSHVLSGVLAAQRDRWILWLSVGMIAGAAGWLLAPADPPAWAAGAIFILAVAAALLAALWPSASPAGPVMAMRSAIAGLCALTASVGLGMGAAQLRTWSVMAAPFPALETPVRVEGWVVANEPSARGPRLRLLVRNIEGMDTPPRYIRVSVPAAGQLTPGRAAQCRAVLGPPAGPMAPGAYDFARRAFFERLSATGFAFGRCRPADIGAPIAWLDRQRLHLAALRADLSAAILEAAPGRGGAIASALVTGDRGAVDEPTNEALRNSGLGHLLSVSGVHMSVVGGLVFAALIWTLALIGPLALRWPVKKLAAIGALSTLALYLVISGTSVPALRSFVMAGVAFGAILLDRPAISMRGLALAAMIVVLLFPESVIEPGFQMSFAATMALVALFEILKRGPQDRDLPTPGLLIGALQWISRGIGGVICISLVAGLATDPFAIYHFQRFSVYALASNLVVAPIMSFLVAPAAGIAALLAPFGLADAPLQVMASALDLVAAVGEAFGSRPEAVRALPKPPDAAFVACVTALLWACLWRGRLRWGAIGFFALSLMIYLTAPPVGAAFDADLRAVFGRDAQTGNWSLVDTGGRSSYARERLGGMLGISPADLEHMPEPETCSAALCTWAATPSSLIMVRERAGFSAACQAGAILVSGLPAPADYAAQCRLAALIDAQDLTQYGGALLYRTGQGWRIERAWPTNVRRPWTPLARPSSDQE